MRYKYSVYDMASYLQISVTVPSNTMLAVGTGVCIGAALTGVLLTSRKKKTELFIKSSTTDDKILHLVSKRVVSPEILLDLGIGLEIEHSAIQTSLTDNPHSIVMAAFSMLTTKWYLKQDGLGRNDKGLDKLIKALECAKLNQCIGEIQDIVLAGK